MKLSRHITVEEFERSQTATRLRLRNKMGATEKSRATALCTLVLDKIRDFYGKPLILSSGYRCLELNRAIGSSDDSQHILGEAGDFTIQGVPTGQVFRDICSGRLPLDFDQVIFEGTWIHISYRPGHNRKQKLKATFTKHGTTYHAA